MAEKATPRKAKPKPAAKSAPKAAAAARRAPVAIKTKPAPAVKPARARAVATAAPVPPPAAPKLVARAKSAPVKAAPSKPARAKLAAAVTAAPNKAAGPASYAPVAARRSRVPRVKVSVGIPDVVTTFPDQDEELRIESAKYAVRDAAPARVFEEERFLFPETYESDRVRLLVKDPEWLFAHWDVSPASWQGVRASLGERALALSRLTLKVEDPGSGALSVVLLPEGARSWYVRTQFDHRAYRAQLGLTTPSGEFRRLAMSNVVVAPRVGPASLRPARRVAVSQAGEIAAERAVDPGSPVAAASPRGHAGEAPGTATTPQPVALVDGNDGTPDAVARALPDRGGASDVFSR